MELNIPPEQSPVIPLEQFGWDEFFEGHFKPFRKKGFEPGRVVIQHPGLYTLYTRQGELLGRLAGSLRHRLKEPADFPAVGDWVVVRPAGKDEQAVIHDLLPRKTKFSRKMAGDTTREQVAASNMDVVFIVTSMNKEFSARRVERYLVLTRESGARPVVVLSKADLCPDTAPYVAAIREVAPDVDIHTVSSVDDRGIDDLRSYFANHSTVALLGSSGVGKSTLINAVLGYDRQAVQEVREVSDRGRHTTTHRELIPMKDGGIIMDTPGMSEIQLWEVASGVKDAFEDVQQLSEACKFRNCKHFSEPGCAVRAGVEEGKITRDRYANYKKMQEEHEQLIQKQAERKWDGKQRPQPRSIRKKPKG